MKQLLVCIVSLSLFPGIARADLTLGMSNPPGDPLVMSAGTTSGQAFASVVSDNPPSDVMAGWQFKLEISPEGASGTLMLQDPATGTPANPTNYVFGTNGVGIAATNSGNVLSANDFYFDQSGMTTGAIVPGSSGANLLQVDFLASPDASGLFGIYAVEGSGNTVWTDSSFTTQFFTNVPDGTDAVLIGEVMVTGAVVSVPESSMLWVFGLGVAALAAWESRCRRIHAAKAFSRKRFAEVPRATSADAAQLTC
jgi:hypothetical protein